MKLKSVYGDMRILIPLLSSLVFQVIGGGLVVVRDDLQPRHKREVGPVGVEGVGGNNRHTSGHRKYRRLQHSILVQADIRSRLVMMMLM